MKALHPMLALIALLIVQLICCGGPVTPTPEPARPSVPEITEPPVVEEETEPPVQEPEVTEPPESEPPSSRIGTIQVGVREFESGPVNNMRPAWDGCDLNDQDSVYVHDGGSGTLYFDDGTYLTLYNKTQVAGVSAQISPPEVDLLLQNQGFLGEVPAGHHVEIRLPNHGRITIRGTLFFVIFNEGAGLGTVGNFHGNVAYTTPDGIETILPEAKMVDIFANAQISPLLDIGFSPAEFEDAAIGQSTPLQGMAYLRALTGIVPQGGPYVFELPEVPVANRALVAYQGGSYVPDLAASWEVDPDGYSYLFHLQPGLLLGDGTPFTSSTVSDMLYSNWSYAMSGDVTIEIIDDYTIHITKHSYNIDVLTDLSAMLYDIRIH